MSGYYPRASARDAALMEAGELSSNGHWPDARAVYLWVLARHDEDPEALFGLARVDAWGGCWAMAEAEYRRVLAAHPGDADVRAGYVDLLIWRGRLDDAEATLEQGLKVDPHASALLARAARFAYWRGDARAAVRLADDAERRAPEDGDVRAMRDRMFLGEARLTLRADFYPSGYPNLYSIAAQALQRIGLFELSGGAQMLERLGGGSTTPVLDVRYPLDVVYHPALGALVGVEVAPGAPANAIPNMALKGWALVPVRGPFDAFVAYSFWHFATGEEVHIVNPALGMALPWEFRLEVRSWISWAILGERSQPESAVGGQLSWSPTSRLSAGITYTYGAEVDQVPTLNLLLEYQSHVAGAFADVLLDRRVGIRPLLAAERRENQKTHVAIGIVSAEIGVYARW